MAVRHNSPQTAKETMSSKTESLNKANTETRKEMIDDHLPPLSLVLTVLLCSGALSVLAMRDFAATGKNILGSIDEPMLVNALMMEFVMISSYTHYFSHSHEYSFSQNQPIGLNMPKDGSRHRAALARFNRSQLIPIIWVAFSFGN